MAAAVPKKAGELDEWKQMILWTIDLSLNSPKSHLKSTVDEDEILEFLAKVSNSSHMPTVKGHTRYVTTIKEAESKQIVHIQMSTLSESDAKCALVAAPKKKTATVDSHFIIVCSMEFVTEGGVRKTAVMGLPKSALLNIQTT